jgi:hypothetical protein
MAGKVIVDIPGIGAFEAENAASESTLRELVNLMKAANKPQGGGGGGSSSGSKAAGKVVTPLTKAIGDGGNKASVVGKLKMLGGSALVLGAKLIDTANVAAKMIGSISSLDNSVSGAASSIPLVGGMFAEVAQASEKLVDSFQSASGSGAGFGGSVTEMAASAATAGMTLQQYSGFIRQNGDAMRLLGGTVDGGVKRFKELGKEMRSTGMMTQLNTLGFTSEQVNEGMAQYASILGRTGRLQNMSTQQLAQRSANYMKEIDKLAKATGQEREQIEENQAKLLADAQFQAKVQSMSVEAGDALRNTITGLPGPLQDIAKDIIGTGTATTEASEQFIATMPESAALMQRFNQITEQGGTVTEEMQQQLQNTLREEGNVRREQFRDQGRYNAEMADTYMAMVAAGNIQRDALVNAAEEQENQIEATDGAVAGMEAMRRRINEVSIEFTNILASSGLLGSMMNAFGLFTNFLKAIVVPVFNILSTAINVVIFALKPLSIALGLFGDLWTRYVSPAFTKLNQLITGLTNVMDPLVKYVGLNLLKAFYFIGDTIQDFVQPAFDFIGRIVRSVADYFQETWTPIFQNIGNWFQTTFIAPFQAATEYIANFLQPAFDTLGGIVGWVADKFNAVYTAITDFFDSFRTLDDVITGLSLILDGVKIGFRELMLDLSDGIASLPFMGRDAAEQEEAMRERMRLEEDAIDLERRKQQFNERQESNIQLSRAEREAADQERFAARQARDAALDASIQQSANEMFDAIGFTGVEATERNIEDQYDAAAEAAREYSDPIAILGSELERQNSAILNMDAQGRRSLEPADNTNEPLTIPIEYDPADPNSSRATPDSPEAEVARQVALNTSAMEEMVSLQRATLRALNRNVAATEGLDSRVI